MGIAAYFVWRTGVRSRSALQIFGIQLALNVLWSLIFFGLQNPGAAFIEIILLWLAIVWTIYAFSRHSKLAAWLLVPYIAWVSFASVLNYFIWVLN
jgi:tryptophan-rich sensory protein